MRFSEVGLKYVTNIFKVSESSLRAVLSQRSVFQVNGEHWVVRFLRVSAPCYPAEVFKLHANPGGTLRVSLTHMFALKGSLSQWLKEKGPLRATGIYVLTPERKISKVLEIEGGKAQLSDGTSWTLESLRPFLSWEELSSGLRKKTLSYRSITPKEVIRKVRALVDALFPDAEPIEDLEFGTFWRPQNLLFGSGLRGSYSSELFLGPKPFYKPPEPVEVSFLLPNDPENSPYADYFYQIVQRARERLSEIGLQISGFYKVYYDPADEGSLRRAVESLKGAQFVLGIVVPPKLWTEHDPYFYTKRALWEARVPSQMVKISTLKKFSDKYGFSEHIWADELWQGLWVNVALKAGGIPWLIVDAGAEGEVEGVVWGEEGSAKVRFDRHARLLEWRLEPGEPRSDAPLVHVLEPEPVGKAVVSVQPSEIQIGPADHRTKLLSGFWVRDPDEPDVYHVATESWSSYREFNLYKVKVVSGSVPPERAANQVFWFARAYLSTFPKGPYPVSLHFPRLALRALENGIFSWGDGEKVPYFI